VPEPVRTCVGCRRTSPKGTMVRVVRAQDGGVAADPTGKAPGRGAYVHPVPACIDLALRRGALARALRAGLDREGAVRLRADLERLPGSPGSTDTGSTETGSTERQAGTT
jgi:uncharacterized protein